MLEDNILKYSSFLSHILEIIQMQYTRLILLLLLLFLLNKNNPFLP